MDQTSKTTAMNQAKSTNAANDAYYEQVRTAMGKFSQEQLIERIKSCEEIIDKLTADPVWQTVTTDAVQWVRRLDAKWAETYDEQSLAQLRVLKLAYSHISSLPQKYKVDLKTAQELLDGMRNTDTSIQKDYDAEIPQGDA